MNKFTRIQDPEDREKYPSLLYDLRKTALDRTAVGMHPDDFIEQYLNHDLDCREQQMLSDFYRVNLWWQDRDD